MKNRKVTACIIAAAMLMSTVCVPSVSFADTTQDKEKAASELSAAQKEKDDLLEKYETVKSEYEAAVTEKKTVQSTLAKAEKEFAEVKTDLDHSFTIERTGATSLIKYKQDLIKQYQPKLDAAEKELAAAQAAYDQAKNAANLTEYDQRIADIENSITKAESELISKEAALKTEEDTYKEAGKQFILSKTMPQLDIDMLTTHFASKEATSPYVTSEYYEKVLDSCFLPDNLLKAADYVDECNSLRARHGAGEVLINYRLMLFSAVSAAISAQKNGHVAVKNLGESFSPGIIPSPYENLIWLSFPGAYPFDGWYTEEKEYYDAHGNDGGRTVGHYLNIINKNHKITGYALTSEICPLTYNESYFGDMYVQEQCFSSGTYTDYGENVTTQQFRQQLNAAVSTQKQSYDAALKAVTDTEQSIKDLTAEKYDVIREKKAAEAAAAEGLTEYENALKTARRNFNNYDFVINKYKDDIQAAQEKLNRLDSFDIDKKETYEGIAAVEKAAEKVLAVRETVTAAQQKLAELDALIETKRSEAETAKAAYEAAYMIYLEADARYDIYRISIEGASVTGIKNKVYSAKNIEQDILVDLDGKTLSEGDYSVTYENNKKVGTAKVLIQGKGEYKGKIEKTFTISPKKTMIKNVTVEAKAFTVQWKKQKAQTNGYQIIYSTKKNFASNEKIVTVKSKSAVSKKISGLKSKTRYYVKVRTYKKSCGKKYVSKWSNVFSVMTR